MRFVISVAIAGALAGCSNAPVYRCDVDGFYVIPPDDHSSAATEAFAKNGALFDRRLQHQLKTRGYTSEASLEKAEGCP